MIKSFNLAAYAAALLLAGCGGNGPDSDEPLPLKTGNRWVYQYTNSTFGSGISTYEVTGTRQIDGRTAYVMHDDFEFWDGPHDTPLVPSDSAVIRYPANNATPEEIEDGPLTILRLPLKTGDAWTDLDETIDAGFDEDDDGINEIETITFRSEVGAPVSVNTPAGSFSEAYPVTSRYERQYVNPVTHVVLDTSYKTRREWYALGFGVVRREVYLQPYGQWRDYYSTEVLASARLVD
jgi:hypothetical protein